MATRKHGYRIEKATVRASLKARREPYWTSLGERHALGFRKSKVGIGSFIARWTEPSQQEGSTRPKYLQEVVAPANTPYAKALELTDEFFKKCERTWKTRLLGEVTDQPETVEEVCRAHIKNLRVAKGDLPADNMEKRFKYYVYKHSIAKTHKNDLTAQQVLTWRNGLVTADRKRNTVNRIFRDFCAAMNAAYKLGMIDSDQAWRKVGQFPVQDGSREQYLTIDQRRLLLAECEREKTADDYVDKRDRKEMPWCTKDLGNLLRGWFISGARPGELAHAKVSDLKVRDVKITLMSAKNKKGESRPRDFYLYEPGALEFFQSMAADKKPDDYLFTKTDGSAWVDEKGKCRYQQWGRGLRAAVRSINRHVKEKDRIPEGTVAYTSRHVVITDLLSEDNIDVKAVELTTGTSAAMMKKTYYHIVRERLKDKLLKRVSI